MALSITHLVWKGLKANLPEAASREAAFYFCTDSKELFHGAELYTEAVRFYSGEANKPAVPAQGVLYFDETTGVGSIWTGSAWKVVISPIAAADNSVTIGGTVSAPTIGVKISSAAGNALSIDDTEGQEGLKVIVPAASEYSVVKDATAEEGYLSTYHLTKDGTNVGAAINIPKDFLVKSASVETVVTEDDPYTGASVGDKFIDMVINVKEGTATAEHIYLPVNELVDVYTSGNGIDISNANVVSVKIDSTNANGLSADSDGLKLGLASTSAAGAMSAADKTKLGGMSEGANKVEASETNGNIKIDGTETAVYTHPTTTANAAAFVKVGNDAAGHVVVGDAIVKADITALGIPAQDTTYTAATTSADGLMSAADKTDHDALVAALTVGTF